MEALVAMVGEFVQSVEARLGFGRITASEIEAPNMLANLV
jgi:hypothetical protein